MLLLAWALLLAAWVVGNPPFAAPDEADHYIRAIGISEGHLLGRPDHSAHIGVDARQVAWVAQAARFVSVPRGFDPTRFGCELGPGAQSAACLNAVDLEPPPVVLVTAVGNYQPFPYLLPALVVRAGSSPAAALRLARAITALMTLALLAIAVFALFDAACARLSLLGPLLAVTPMVLFCGASLNGSATEIAGGIAFFACLLRLGRDGPVPTRWWALTALSGAALTLSRSASPAWLVIALLIAVVWSGPRVFTRRWAAGWAPRVTAAVLAAALALNRVWEAAHGSHVTLDTGQLHAGLVAGVHEWWIALPELIGKFGYLDVKLPLIIPVVWLGLVTALLASAAVVCGRRERVLLAVVTIGALAGPVVFYAVLLRPTGFGLQGRHILPILVAVPLLAGEALRRHRERASAVWLRALINTSAAAVAVMAPAAWYVNAKRYAVGGSGPVWFLGQAAWSPPGGWWIWLIAVVAAGICLASLAVWRLPLRASRGADPRPA